MIRSMNCQARRLVPAVLLALIVASCAVAPAFAVQETQTDRGSDPRDGNRQSEQPSGAGLLGRAFWGGWALFTGHWWAYPGCGGCHDDGTSNSHNAEQRAREGNGSSNF